MKGISISIILAALIIGGALVLVKKNNADASLSSVNNVSVVDGKQIIEITARGGYLPRISKAKSGLPTIVRFNTNGTFDCSASVRIPLLNISKALPSSGTTDIDIGTQKISVLQGTCGMGMYPFQITFN